MHLLRHRRAPKPKAVVERVGYSDVATLQVMRGRRVEDSLRIGPNIVHAAIIHGPGRPNDWPEGSVEDLGYSHNLLNTDGRDLVSAGLGTFGGPGAGNVATASSATSLTDTGEAWTTDQFKGWTVIAEESTNTPVMGNIGSNTGTVLTVDQWWNGDNTTGTTPGATANYFIIPTCRPRFMALTENASAAAAGNTTLTGEITTGGAARALTTYAHTNDAATLTLQKSFSITASFPAIHRMGLFTASTSTAAGIMVFESVLNADANVINGDTLQVTDTITLS